MRPSPGYRLLGFLSGTQTQSLILAQVTVSNSMEVTSLPPVCCPSGSFMGLAQLVSNPPLIYSPAPNQPQLVLSGGPVETWHVQQMKPSPIDLYSICYQTSTSLPLVADLLYATRYNTESEAELAAVVPIIIRIQLFVGILKLLRRYLPIKEPWDWLHCMVNGGGFIQPLVSCL